MVSIFEKTRLSSKQQARVEVLSTGAGRRLDAVRSNDGARWGIQLAEAGSVCLVVYDLVGRPVRRRQEMRLSDGVHTLEWNGVSDGELNLPRGSYFCRLTIESAGSPASAYRVSLTR